MKQSMIALWAAYALLVGITGWMTWRIESGFDHAEDLTCALARQEVRAAVLQIELDTGLSDEDAAVFAETLNEIVAIIEANC